MSTLKEYRDGQWKHVNGQITGDTLPIGSIVPYGSSTAPTNWLVCDGSAVSRTTYAELFAVIGTSFGTGDGSTTFNLPNLKGRVAVGIDTSDTSFDTMGETGGSKNAVVVSHNHDVSWLGNPAYPVSLNHEGTSGYHLKEWESGAGSGGFGAITTGESGTNKNLQPYQVVCYIIKVKQSVGVVGSVLNTSSNSQTDTYSCDYANTMKVGGIKTVSDAGYETDNIGNFQHQRSSASDYLNMKDNAGNIRFQYYWETGKLLLNNAEVLVPYTLLSEDASSGSYTLSDSIQNYKYIEVFYRTNDGSEAVGSIKFKVGSGSKTISPWYTWIVSGTLYAKTANISLSGTTLSFLSNYQIALNDSNVQSGSYIYVQYVIGYK